MDICSNNIMILNDNRVVVVDFGFSKFSDVAKREPLKLMTHQSSKRGGLGTLGYVAPENGNNPLWKEIFAHFFELACSCEKSLRHSFISSLCFIFV